MKIEEKTSAAVETEVMETVEKEETPQIRSRAVTLMMIKKAEERKTRALMEMVVVTVIEICRKMIMTRKMVVVAGAVDAAVLIADTTAVETTQEATINIEIEGAGTPMALHPE